LSVLDGRLIAGYQGWFGCPGDYQGNATWFHWFSGPAQVNRLTVDMFPDVSQLPASSLCDTGLVKADGSTLKVYSAMDPALVDLHFAQMAAHGVGAVALSRFVNQFSNPQWKLRVDRVLDNALAAAQHNHLPLFIEYDVSMSDETSVYALIGADWTDVNARYGLATHEGYLKNAGTPVLQIWGFGFTDRPGAPSPVTQLIGDLKTGNGVPAAFLIGGVPSRWDTLDGDSKSDPAWAGVYAQWDVLSPWTVGAYRTADEATSLIGQSGMAQKVAAEARGQVFLPVVYPGFSWRNLSGTRNAVAPLNAIPRDCGRLFDAEVSQVVANGNQSFYVAMFDEVDEATAMMPTLASQDQLPAGVSAVSLDMDGCALPSDFYLGSMARAAARLK